MSSKLCPICKLEFNNLWKHFWSSHNDLELSDEEFLCKYLNLDKIPICINCNNKATINYSKYKFNKTCSTKCSTKLRLGSTRSLNFSRKYTCNKCGREFTKQSYAAHRCFRTNSDNALVVWRSKQSLETLKLIHDKAVITQKLTGVMDRSILAMRLGYSKLSKSVIHQTAVRAGLNSVEVRKFKGKHNYYSSKIEIDLYNRLKCLFPNYTIYGYNSDFHVSIYKPDIYIKELNLIIEVDGYKFHDIEKDIKRDKFICNELNCKIKRLDADYVKYYLSDDELICNILVELIQPTNYYDRIPIEDINHWKWYPYITGPRLLLSYDRLL